MMGVFVLIGVVNTDDSVALHADTGDGAGPSSAAAEHASEPTTDKEARAARETDVLQEACALVPENKRPEASQKPCMMPMPEWVAERPAKKAGEAFRALPPVCLHSYLLLS